MIQNILKALTYKKILLLQALAAAIALGSAFVAQYGFSLFPCHLCLLQRYPYGAIIALGLLAAWRKPTVFFVLLLTLIFAVDASIAFYHTGVELDIFKGPDGCSAGDSGEQTIEEMRAAIMNAPLVSCKQAMAYFFGMSMAAWNGLYASICILLSILGCMYVRRK